MSVELQTTVFKIIGFLAQIAGVLSIVMIGLSILSVLNSTRRERKLTSRKLIISIALSLASLAVLLYFSKIAVESEQWFIFGGIGAAIGFVWARTIKVYPKDDGIYNKNTLMYVVVWGVTMVISQFLGTLRTDYANAAALASILSAGIVVGMNGLLLKQFLDLSKQSI